MILAILISIKIIHEYSYDYLINNKNHVHTFVVNGVNNGNKDEHFAVSGSDGELYDGNVAYFPEKYSDWFPFFNIGNLFPWWNSTRFTHNMSYDIRGDVYTPYTYNGPWWSSPF